MEFEIIKGKNTNGADKLNLENPPYAEIEKMNIEEIAGLLTTGKLPDYKYRQTVNLLVLKLSEKAHQGWATQRDVIDKTFEETSGSESVSGIISTKTLEFALKTYGKKDEKTGKVIPFEKLFWAAFGLKNQDITTEHLNNTKGDEQKARAEEVKQLVQKIARKNHKLHLIPRISLLKKENLKKVLAQVGATNEEFQKGERLLEDTIVCRDICFDEIGEESGSYLSDTVSIDNNHDSESALDMMISAMHEALNLAKNERERKTLLCLATLSIADYIPSGNYAAISDLTSLVEPELLKQLLTTRKKDKELLMDFLKIQDRELRRRLGRAKELLNMGYDLALGRNTAA